MGNETDKQLVLTSSGLLAFLSQIEELNGKDNLGISITEDGDGFKVYIGNSIYELTSDANSDVEVSDEVVDIIQDIDEEGYEELGDEFEEIDDEIVEGGIIKELIKTLAIGGLVRLTKSALTS